MNPRDDLPSLSSLHVNATGIVFAPYDISHIGLLRTDRLVLTSNTSGDVSRTLRLGDTMLNASLSNRPLCSEEAPDPRVIYLSNKLELETLRVLFEPESKVLAVRVRNYISPALCALFTDRLIAESELSFRHYTFAPKLDVTRMGMLFAEACFDPNLMDAYFEQVSETETLLRTTFTPYLSPIDQLRLDLDTLWPQGAMIPHMFGRRMLSGFIRNTSIGAEITPHQDDLLEECPSPPGFTCTAELVANVYLSAPPEGEGGELQIYDYRPGYSNAVDEIYGQNKDKEEAYLLPSELDKLDSQPSVVLKPEAGDLIIFIPKCVHRVHKVKSGSRITSCFHIGYTNDAEPLRCWV